MTGRRGEDPAGSPDDAADDDMGNDAAHDAAADAALLAARTERLLRQARDGIDRLARDPRDPVGRGLLGEAVAKLEGDPPAWLAEASRDLLRPRDPETPIRTERLSLRRVTPADADVLHSYYGRADVATYLLTPPLTRAETAGEVRRRLRFGGPGSPADQATKAFSVVVELDGEVVGDVLLIHQPPHFSEAEIGWVLHPDHGGRGIATEAAGALLDLAFGHYGYHRVSAVLDARNAASAAVAERLGMRREAHLRRDYWSKGEWTDSLRYGLLAEEWVGRR